MEEEEEEEEEEEKEEEEVACFALYVVVSRKGAKVRIGMRRTCVVFELTSFPPSLPPSLHT